MVPKAHWLKAVMISGLAILYSEMAEAERLRLECSVKTECYPERIIRGFQEIHRLVYWWKSTWKQTRGWNSLHTRMESKPAAQET